MNQLKAEFRKLLSVRSTYVITIIALLLVGLFTYFGTSPRTYEVATCVDTGQIVYSDEFFDSKLETMSTEEICGGEVKLTTATNRTLQKDRLINTWQETVSLVMTFSTFVLILLVVHEYRYNTINYTLTISNNRSKVLVSKLIVGTVFMLFTTVLGIAFATLITSVAIALKDLVLPTQDYNFTYYTARYVVYALGNGLIFMGVAFLVRNQVASIASVFILPIIDGLGGYLLSLREIDPTRVLPFVALERFGNVMGDLAGVPTDVGENYLNASDKLPPSPIGALTVFGVYLIVLWGINWYLFIRRDAN